MKALRIERPAWSDLERKKAKDRNNWKTFVFGLCSRGGTTGTD